MSCRGYKRVVSLMSSIESKVTKISSFCDMHYLFIAATALSKNIPIKVTYFSMMEENSSMVSM